MSRVKYLSVTRGQKVHIKQYPNFHKSGSIKGMKENTTAKMQCLYVAEIIFIMCRKEFMIWQTN